MGGRGDDDAGSGGGGSGGSGSSSSDSNNERPLSAASRALNEAIKGRIDLERYADMIRDINS